ncbi:hypothetical protein [Phaeospirillum tilakii]|uniref:Uncharacterized protein n=1 Tax=Phaeospirillum tilakii TaxID=741673 RepID=A0ABW5CDR9_9PROT
MPANPSTVNDFGAAGVAGGVLAFAHLLEPLLQVVVLALTAVFLAQGVTLRRRALKSRITPEPEDDIQ